MTRTYTLRLRLQGPCHVGSGRRVGKKEYYYDRAGRRVVFYDPEKLMACIVQNGLVV